MRRFRVFAAFAASLLLALPAVAQDRAGTWEISPFAGGYFGGRLYGNYTVPFSSGTVSNVRFLEPDDDLAYGARLAYNITRHFGFEVDWTSSRTDLRSPNFRSSVPRNLKVGTLRQDVYEANALFNFGRRHVIGYIGIGAGGAVLKRDVAGIDPSSKGRFTANVSAGGKFFFVPRVGIRIDGRYRAINLTDDRDDSSCDHNDFCNDRRNWSYNGEVTGGLVFAF
jgi:opacity protein-like surface antigen